MLDAPIPIDHRPRVAAERRARMRRKLVESALFVFAEKGVDASVIEVVIRPWGRETSCAHACMNGPPLGRLQQAVRRVSTGQVVDQRVAHLQLLVWPALGGSKAASN